MTTDNSRPAFPCEELTSNWSTDPLASPRRFARPGLTKREWFAGQALMCPDIGRIAFNFRDADLDRHFGKGAVNITDAMKLAAAARDVADAMLATLKGETP